MHAIMEASEISEADESLKVEKNDLEKQEEKKINMQQIQLEVNLTLKQVRIFSFSKLIFTTFGCITNFFYRSLFYSFFFRLVI